MFESIAYISAPYTSGDVASEELAISSLQKAIGRFILENPGWVAVNALFSDWDETQKAPADVLIPLCDVFVVLTLPGWEDNEVIRNEASIAAVEGHTIMYMSPANE